MSQLNMANMTYRQLQAAIAELDETELDAVVQIGLVDDFGNRESDMRAIHLRPWIADRKPEIYYVDENVYLVGRLERRDVQN